MTRRTRLILVLAAIPLLAGALYAVLWFRLASAVDDGLTLWAAGRRAQGWQVSYAAPKVTGFPLAVTSTLTDLVVAIPGLATWRAPPLTIAIVPWRPLAVALTAPGVHTLEALGLPPLTITTQAAAGTLTLTGAGLFDRFEGDAQTVALAVAGQGVASIGGLDASVADLHAEHAAHTDATWSFGLTLRDLHLPPGKLVLEPNVAAAALSGRVLGAIPPGPPAVALDAWRQDGGRIELDAWRLRWAPLEAVGEGTLALDPAMQPVAALNARVQGLFDFVDRLVQAHLMAAGDARVAKLVLGLLAKPTTAGGAPELAVPVTLQDGVLKLGPAAVARVPAISWK